MVNNLFLLPWQSLEETKQRLDELEQEKLQNLPVDTAKEIALLQSLVVRSQSNVN